jgi:outer membrane protein
MEATKAKGASYPACQKAHAMPTPRFSCACTALLSALSALSGGRWASAQTAESTSTLARQLTLAEVERVALEQQPQVLLARAQTGVAEASADQVRAPLLPQVVGTAQYTRLTTNFAPRPGSVPGTLVAGGRTSLTDSQDYWNFGVNATQLIYDFGQSTGRYRAAEANVDAQRSSERATRLQVLSVARRAYFYARAQKELVDVARETLDSQQKHLTQVRGSVEVGIQPPIALSTQRAAVANAQVQLITAQNNYETAKAQLNQAAGIPGSTDYDVGDELLPPVDDEDQPLETLVVKAIAARPEMATLVKQREVQEATVRSARGGYGPTLSAAAGATEAGTKIDSLVPNWSAGLLLNWPIFQGGLTQGQIRQAEAALASVHAQQSIEQLQVRLDVDTARLGVLAAKATISAAQDALENARAQLRLAEQRYATGVGNIIELTDAQATSNAAAAQVVNARYQLASARAQLLAALGRT